MGLFSKIREVRQKKKTSGLKGSAGLPSPSIGPPTYRPTSPEPSSQPTPEATPLPRSDFEPWTRAYEILQTREPELIEDYKKHLGSLGSLQRDGATDADLSTPRSVESIVKQLLDDQEKKQWRVSLLGKELLTSGTSKNKAMLRGFNSIGNIQVYWDIYKKTYLRSSHQQRYQDLMEPLAKLYSHIIEYQALTICHLSRAQLSRAWQNVAGWNDWDGKAAKIIDLSRHCSSYIPPLKAEEIRQNRDSQLQEMQESRTILNEIQMVLEAESKQTRRNYEDQKEQDLLQDFTADYKDYKDFNPARVQGTFLSRALVDERRLSTNISTSTICYFFFKDGDERRMYTTNALCAILYQLFTHDPASGLIGHALPSHKNYGKSLAQNFSKLWRILMDSTDSPDTGEIVCVLDALDECSKDGRKQLIDKLKEFYCRPSRTTNPLSKLKFLITSRPYDDLEESFKGFSDTTAYLRFDGDEKSAQISKEVNLVINAKVDEIARDFEEGDRRKISEQLKSMEHRTYLWLHLTFNIIEQSPSEYGRRCDVEALLSDLPSEVSQAYEKILGRSKNQIHTETLLQIVLAAARPLTLDEANTALTLALQKQRFISYTELKSNLWSPKVFKSIVRNLCSLFISVYNSKLSFIH
ncbi:hypothetical protein CNMCM5623_006911 [Aspergillus felis]|uniref:NWD NACHT-NTPase N-terminal domain-containing protein n=1 Tax=Aspergillus felis TaxID=1287682 RepID=A0A8H6URA0_9EURO|nr:hypothetical protein CNMCM5623_006911 [Aspergillus felis]